MSTRLHIDFETRSTVDLKAAGLDNYARHPDTDVWCMAYAFGDDEPSIWTPADDKVDPKTEAGIAVIRRRNDILGHVVHGAGEWQGGIVVAHNAAFELAIWNQIMVPRYGWPPLKPEQVRCTMAMAYAMALPGALDNAAAAVGINHRKDAAGYRLMMQMCRPREIIEVKAESFVHGKQPDERVIIWWDEPAKLQQLYEYCRQDVRVERELEKRLMPLSDDEQALWVLDYKINQRGIYIDRPAAEKAIAIVQLETERLNGEMRRITDNFVGFCTETARLLAWVRKQGVEMPGVAKADVLDALDLAALPDKVRAALLIRQEAGKSSTAKLRAMTEAASADNRLRGMLQYHGAGTGRWAGRKVQLQNMPRPSIGQDEINEVFEVLG